MSDIATRLAVVRARISAAALGCGREPQSVALIAVSKGRPPCDVRAARTAGQRRFGESYFQEAITKIRSLINLDLEWHFIGPMQSNKTRGIAAHFDWVHSVDRLVIAQRLSAQRPAELAPLNICLQVNISGEATKSGTALGELPALARAVSELPRLNLRGLMTIPAPSSDPCEQRRAYHRLLETQRRLRRENLVLDTMSMGMSDDLEAAIAEGATMVRVGSAIFGVRPSRGR